jgi:hypothetical protein
VFLIIGLRVVFTTIAQGVFYCRNCDGDRNYRHRSGRRFITLFFIPVIPLNKVGEDVQCATCKTRYVTSVLQAPAAAAARAAIPSGARAIAAVMLRTGGLDNAAARGRAIDLVRSAGARDYDDTALTADLGQSLDAARPVIAQFGTRLSPELKERYLAGAIRIALADGPLTGNERATAEMIAVDMAMTKAQSLGVITMTEQSAPQS